VTDSRRDTLYSQRIIVNWTPYLLAVKISRQVVCVLLTLQTSLYLERELSLGRQRSASLNLLSGTPSPHSIGLDCTATFKRFQKPYFFSAMLSLLYLFFIISDSCIASWARCRPDTKPILPRDAMHKRGLYAVVRCLSVTFVHCVETVKNTAIVAMECEQKTVLKLSTGTIFGDRK